MTQQLETDLVRAFSLRSSGVPDDVGARLREIDYHPRTSRIPPRVTLGSLAGIPTATGAVVSVAVLASAQPAFAGWTASPAPAATVKSFGAEKVCQAQLARTPGIPGAAPVSGWHPVTSDVRGPFTLVIYQAGGRDATCLTGPAITVVSRSSANGGSTSASGTVGGRHGSRATSSIGIDGLSSSSIKHMSIAHLASASQGPYTLVEGQVDQGVTGVTLVRSDGDHIEATTGNGSFVAWWPGSLSATSAQITTATGVTTQALRRTSPLPSTRKGSCILSSRTGSSVVCRGGAAGGGTGGPPAVLPGGSVSSPSSANGG